MSFPQRYGPWALVVGAALGLGAEFCRQLAERGLNLVMVALEKDELDALATDLADRYGIRTQTVTGDITAPEVLESVALLVGDADHSHGRSRRRDHHRAAAPGSQGIERGLHLR